MGESAKAVSLSEQMSMVQDAISNATSRLPDAWAVEVFPDYAIIEMDGSFLIDQEYCRG